MNNQFRFKLLVFKSIFLVMLLALMGSSSLGASSQNATIPPKLALIISDSVDEKTQIKYFNDFVLSNLKYAHVRSLLGSDEKWLAFIDIYENYIDGEPTETYFTQATVQYGLEKLPLSTKNCTLYFGKKAVKTLVYNKDPVFSFNSIQLEAVSKTDVSRIVVQNANSTIKISMLQDYPNKSTTSYSGALAAMMPEYINFIKKNGYFEVDHSVIKLKSYLKDVESLKRSFAWEMFLVSKDTFPCKATVIRYDCMTKKISITHKEIRDYN